MTLTIAIIILTCLISITSFNRPDQIDKLSFWPYKVSNNREYYRFLTSGFIHGDFMHLFFNMLTLYFFGTVAEANMKMYLGGKFYYIILYVLGLVLPDIYTYFRYKDVYGYRTIGASGAVSAILFSSIFFEPWFQLSFYFVIPIWGIVYGVLYLVYSAYMSRRGGDGINHDAHFWGAVLGFIFPLVMKPELARVFLEKLTRLPF